MPAPVDRDILRLTIVLEIADRVIEQLRGVDRATFLADRDQIDLAAYRLGSIGEYVNKLAPELKARHPHVDWRRVYDMRNALFHDYDGVIPRLLWDAAHEPLAEMIAVCRAELEAKSTNPGPAAAP